MGVPKQLLSRTWRSNLALQPALLPCIDLWRIEVQREKLRSAGHWGEGSRSEIVGVGGGGNDRPTAGASEAPGEREVTEGAHSIQLVLPSPALPMAQATCMRAL